MFVLQYQSGFDLSIWLLVLVVQLHDTVVKYLLNSELAEKDLLRAKF